MKAITRNRWWPAALVAALAVAGILAAFAILTAPGRDAAEAQGLCATATGEALRQLIEAGVCAEPSPTPAPGNTPLPPPTLSPTNTPVPTPISEGQNLCDTATDETLWSLIQAGVCAGSLPTPSPDNTPVPTPIAEGQNLCDTATDETLWSLIQAGVCVGRPSTSLPEGNDVIVITGDTVPGRWIVQVYGLLSAEGNQVDEAKSALMEQAAAVGANAIVDFHLAVDHDVRIAYGTAVVTDCTESIPCLSFCHTPLASDEATRAALIEAGICRPEDIRTLPAPLLGENDVTLVTMDTVPRHYVVRVHGLIVAESNPLYEAQDRIIEQAIAAGANAVVDFRWAADRGLRIAYGTAVTIE